MTQAEFGSSLGIAKSTYSNYENGEREPKAEFWMSVAQRYGVTIDYLMGVSESIRSGAMPRFSDGALTLARDYDALDSHGKHMLRSVADEELNRLNELLELAGTDPAAEPRVINLYLEPSAAGVAAPVAGEDYEPYTLKPQDPQGAAYAVRLQGDSMAPWFPDGSLVFVNHDALADGDIGIFCVDGGTVCKQYHHDPVLGDTYLFSLNRERAEADVVLTCSSGRSLVCQGRVMTGRRFPLPGK